MTSRHWFDRFLGRASRRPSQTKQHWPRTRLAVETLETRLAPAVLTVNSTADTAHNTDPYLSLREAIAIANSPTLPTGLSSQILAQITGTLHAGHSDTIQFDHVHVTTPITLTGTRLVLSLPGSTAAVTLDGGAPAVTVDANNRSEVFEVDGGVQATLAHLTITGGNTDLGSGAGIYNAGTLTVTSSTLSNNHADFSNGGGGAIANGNAGTLTVIGSTFTGNHANNSPRTLPGSSGGGAIFNDGSASVLGSIFTGNHADRTSVSGSASAGGAIYNGGGTMTVFGSTLSDNHADGNYGNGGGALGGGAIFNRATLTVTNSTLGATDDAAANTADQSFGGGGCIYNEGALTVTGSTFSGNHADGITSGAFEGGGAINNRGTLTVTSSTRDGNHDDGSLHGGGAIYVGQGSTTVLSSSTLTANHANGLTYGTFGGGGALTGNNATRLTLVNTIVAQNRTDNGTGPDIFAALDGSGHHNLIGDGSGMSGISNGVNGNQVGTAASPLDPLLGPLQNYGGSTKTRALLAGSPALDAGDPAQLGSTDQQGMPRLGGVNIGAFQATASVFQVGVPGTPTAGTPIAITVTAVDRFGDQAYGYRGPVHFSSTDPRATLPADYTFTAADNGTHMFSSVFRGAASQTITANNGSIGGVTEFTIPTANSLPTEITAEPHGNVWFTEADTNKIGRITQAGVVTEFAIHTSNSRPRGITAGPDGNLWFTEENGNKIGQITPAGTVTEFPLPAFDSEPAEITAGPDGNLWFTEIGGNKIGRITPAGAVTEFPIPTSRSNPTGITVDPHGYLWFVEVLGNKIGRITISGVITEFAIPTANSVPHGITADLDSNLWFTEFNGNKVGKITPAGIVTEFPMPMSSSGPWGITAGVDGNLWFTELEGNKVGRITLPGAVTEFPIPTGGSAPDGITADANGNLWFAEEFGNKVGRITSGSASGSATVNVVAAAANHYTLTTTAANPDVAGTPFTVTVTAQDAYGNTATGYRGTVHFDSTDSRATLPANYTFTAADNGVHTFGGVILRTAGNRLVSAKDTVGNQIGNATVTVVAAAPTQFAVTTSAANPDVAGTPFTVTVTAFDPYGNIATGYTGTVTFSSADPYGASLPADYTFQASDQGQHTFAAGATLYTAGTWDVTATDTASAVSGTANITVIAAAAAQFVVSTDAANPDVAGTVFDVTVVATDPYGNTATNYTGTVAFSSADPYGASLPANYTFQASDQGGATFSGVTALYTAGIWDVTATATQSGITGAAFVNVQAAPAVAFQIVTPASATSGTPFDVTVIAVDPYGNTDTNYTGTVTFSTSDGDPGVVLPPDYTFQPSDQGQVTFPGGVTLITLGDQTLTAADTTSGITGSSTVTVLSGPAPGAGHFRPAATAFASLWTAAPRSGAPASATPWTPALNPGRSVAATGAEDAAALRREAGAAVSLDPRAAVIDWVLSDGARLLPTDALVEVLALTPRGTAP